MTPGPVERLKPYFKPRPRRRNAAKQKDPATAQTQQQAAPVQAATPPAPAPPAPAAGPQGADGLAVRRELLAKRYRELQSDLGGLVYEMAIRDAFRLDVVVRRAAELQAVDAELTAVEQSLGLAPGTPPGVSCPSCGAPAAAASAFCGRCGASLRAPAVSAPAPAPIAAPAPPPAPAAPAPMPPPAAPSAAPVQPNPPAPSTPPPGVPPTQGASS